MKDVTTDSTTHLILKHKSVNISQLCWFYYRVPSVIDNPRSDTQLDTDLMNKSKTFPPFNEAATAK